MRFEKPNTSEAFELNPEEVIEDVIKKAGPERGRGLLSVLKNVLEERSLTQKAPYEWVDADGAIVVDIELYLDMFNKISERLPLIEMPSDPDAEVDALGVREKKKLSKQDDAFKKLEESKKRWGYKED